MIVGCDDYAFVDRIVGVIMEYVDWCDIEFRMNFLFDLVMICNMRIMVKFCMIILIVISAYHICNQCR